MPTYKFRPNASFEYASSTNADMAWGQHSSRSSWMQYIQPEAMGFMRKVT